MDTVSEIIVDFCREVEYEDLPKEVVEKTKLHILDCLGSAIAGSSRSETKKLISLVEQWSGDPQSSVINSRVRVPMVNAAFVNAEMVHDNGLDDLYIKASLHPASVIIPSALAAAEAGQKSGRTFIAGVVLGYEIMAKIGDSIGSKTLYERGFHPTGICGVFGSTVAVGKILDFSRSKFVNALGIAGSQAGGLMEFLSEGSTVKRLHSAMASQSGVLSAILADAGYTGPSTIIEGNTGFFKAYGNRANKMSLFFNEKDEFRIMQTSLKLYPCTGAIESAVNVVLDLKKNHQINHKDIGSITVYIYKAAFPIAVEPIQEKQRPRNSFSAQFSLFYNVATALVNGRLTRGEYTPSALENEEVRALINKINVIADPQMDKLYPEYQPTKITIKTKHGKEFTGDVSIPRGDPRNPLSFDEIVQKFTDLVEPTFGKDRTKKLLLTIIDLEKIDSLSLLGNLLLKE